MFWIYLIIFILIVLVPGLISDKGVGALSEETAEEMAIFLLGSTGFLLFLWKERISNRTLLEKIKIQKETKLMSKNLTDTYFYIGEINRKLDIMKQIALELPKLANAEKNSDKEMFSSIIECIYLMGKSKNFKIVFVDVEKRKTIHEIKGNKRIRIRENIDELLAKEINFIDKDKYFVISSPKSINNICASIIIEKKSKHQKIEDPEIMQALASQALFFFYCMRKPENLK